MKSLLELIGLLDLEKLDDGLFRGQNYVTPWGRVFGGQVLGQALNAAYQTVDPARIAHSLHSYFILPGDVNLPIIYQVQVIRDGGSFSTRRVTAIQKGRPIFVMAASFQLEQKGFSHQNEMPDVDGPENFLTDMEQAEMLKDTLPQIYKKIQARKQDALEFRPVEKIPFEDFMNGKSMRNVWMKVTEKTDIPIPMQHQLLAYASDYDLLLTAVYPHSKEFDMSKVFVASLDHAMWFHREFDFADWLLYAIVSPSASNSRGMGYGRIFDKNGRLVSTVMQEGLIRISR